MTQVVVARGGARERLFLVNARIAPAVALDAKSMAQQRRDKRSRAVRPNVGIEASYRRRLDDMIERMTASVLYWVRATYRANEPEIAQDATPADELRSAVDDLAKRWQKQFDELAPKLAAYFTMSVARRSDALLKRILRDGGFTVKFRMTKAQRDVLQATINQNVDLIKSIPQRYFTEVRGMVQRSVQGGRDLAPLVRDLQKQFGVTRRRAALIARDQNNKATSALSRARQQEVGIQYAIWQHSHAGKEPRPAHVKMNGKRFDIAKGMWDPDEKEWIWPGQLINCRCTSRPVLPGFD